MWFRYVYIQVNTSVIHLWAHLIAGLTGGLAAPLVAAGASAIIGGVGAAAVGSTVGVAIIGSLFGVAGAGLTGELHGWRMEQCSIALFSNV